MKIRDTDLKVTALIVAAGKGTRMGEKINKQYMMLRGMPVISRTIHTFEKCKAVENIVLVANGNDIVFCKQQIVDAYGFTKVRTITGGGATRQESVFKGLTEIGEDCDIVVIHDGARPFVTAGIIEDSIEAAKDYGACCVAVPVKDTIKRGDDSGFVLDTLERKSLWAVQTPQAFKYELILEAHKRALAEGFSGTDDAVLVERMGHRIKLVPGNYSNIKITTREDIPIAEAIARDQEEKGMRNKLD